MHSKKQTKKKEPKKKIKKENHHHLNSFDDNDKDDDKNDDDDLIFRVSLFFLSIGYTNAYAQTAEIWQYNKSIGWKMRNGSAINKAKHGSSEHIIIRHEGSFSRYTLTGQELPFLGNS